ncbi:MAG: DUF3024 domain-containing protein [Nitrospiraceae bacterium]|nr:DUF3024 domain-containing protein [Nitrospiraceae bacterium]
MDRFTGCQVQVHPIANKWRLYWQQADLKWHEYPRASSSDYIRILCKRSMPIHWLDFSDDYERQSN